MVGMKELDEFNHPTNWHLYSQREQQPVTFQRGVKTYTGTLVGVEEPIITDYFGHDIPPRELFFLVEVDGQIMTVNINSFL